MSTLRYLEETDFQPIIQVVDDWWGGRSVAKLLQNAFSCIFDQRELLVEENGTILGFLVGFRSQTTPTQAYIHFVGTHPQHRGNGIGRYLYQHFFEVVRALGCTEVLCITSPVNKGSIAFFIDAWDLRFCRGMQPSMASVSHLTMMGGVEHMCCFAIIW